MRCGHLSCPERYILGCISPASLLLLLTYPVILRSIDVDEQTKSELKALLHRYDRSLLVADPRRMEAKKYGGMGARARYVLSLSCSFASTSVHPHIVLFLTVARSLTDKRILLHALVVVLSSSVYVCIVACDSNTTLVSVF